MIIFFLLLIFTHFFAFFYFYFLPLYYSVSHPTHPILFTPYCPVPVTIVPSGPRVSDWCFLGALESDPPAVRTLHHIIFNKISFFFLNPFYASYNFELLNSFDPVDLIFFH